MTCCSEFSKIHFFAFTFLLCFFCSITLSFDDSIALKRACYNAYLCVSCMCCFIKFRWLYLYFGYLSSMLLPFYCCKNSNFTSYLSSSNVTDNMLQQHADLAPFSTWYYIVDELCYNDKSLPVGICMPSGTDITMGYIFDLFSISMPLMVVLMIVLDALAPVCSLLTRAIKHRKEQYSISFRFLFFYRYSSLMFLSRSSVVKSWIEFSCRAYAKCTFCFLSQMVLVLRACAPAGSCCSFPA